MRCGARVSTQMFAVKSDHCIMLVCCSTSLGPTLLYVNGEVFDVEHHPTEYASCSHRPFIALHERCRTLAQKYSEDASHHGKRTKKRCFPPKLYPSRSDTIRCTQAS